MAEMTAIPQPILDMLKVVWQPGSVPSTFESVADDERLKNPSFYHHGKNQGDYDNNGILASDANALLNASELEGLIKDNGDSIAMNEHAHHALTDFCSEVYDSWRKLQGILESIPRK